MENGVYHDRDRISVDDPGHDRGNGEPLLVGRTDGDRGGQLGVPVQRGVPGVITAGGLAAMDPTVDQTTADDGGEISTARGSHLISENYTYFRAYSTYIVRIGSVSAWLWEFQRRGGPGGYLTRHEN